MKQDSQVTITLACQFLTSQGRHFTIDFGYENAVKQAIALGWDTAQLPWPLYREVYLSDPEIRAYYDEETVLYDAAFDHEEV